MTPQSFLRKYSFHALMSVISIGVAVMPAIHTTDCPVRLVNSEGAGKAGGGEGGTGKWGGGRGGRGGDVGGDGGGVGVDSSNNDSSPMLVGRCDCSKGVLTEIRCYYLTSIPKFLLPPGFDSRQRVFSAIYITRQKITEVPRAAFANIQVSKISLDFNPFGDRLDPESFLGLESGLRELSLGACRIRNLPVGLLKNLNRLERLQLWGNRIEQIPSGFFRGAFNLQVLLMWGNRLEEVEETTFDGLFQLRRLDLDQNKISILSHNAFRHLNKLEALHLGLNSIHAISGEIFSNMANLRVLNLDNNGLGYIYTNAFDRLANLTSLSLNNNHINFLPDGVFVNQKRLLFLWLHNNRLEHAWSKTFDGLRSLRRLYLSNNHLSSLPDGTLRQSAVLQYLDLTGNRINTIRRCVFTSIEGSVSLKSLSLVGNRMQCDCRLLWIKTVIEQGMSLLGTCSVGQPASHAASVNIIGPLLDSDVIKPSSCLSALHQPCKA